ncbi:MAG TPA: hypothetical protein VLE96_05485 [Chlamydiales bacterium]|nr:hypothetical protein [Chlamydiales bacterium]
MRIQGSSNHVHTEHTETVSKHILDEIVSHVVWDKIGSFSGIGHFAAGVLGNLLTFQKLGGGDEFLIPRAISKPMASWDINPSTKQFESCIILANGRKLFGREILDFYQGLQHVIKR